MTKNKEDYAEDPRIKAEEELFEYSSCLLDWETLCLGFLQGQAGESFSLAEFAQHLGVDINRADGILKKHKSLIEGGGWLKRNARGNREKLYNSKLTPLPASPAGEKLLLRRQEVLDLSLEDQAKIKRRQLLEQEAREDLRDRGMMARRKPLKASKYGQVLVIKNARQQDAFNRKSQQAQDNNDSRPPKM